MEETRTAAPAPVTSAPADPLGTLLFILAVAALALTPTQLTISLKGLSLAPSEILLLLAAVVWAARWIIKRDTHSLPPFTHWLLVAAGVCSLVGLITYIPSSVDYANFMQEVRLVNSSEPGLRPEVGLPFMQSYLNPGALKDSIKEIAQTILYLLLAVTVFRGAFTSPARIRIAFTAVLATTTLAVLFGTVQWVQLQKYYQPNPAQRYVFGDENARREDGEAKVKHAKMGVWEGDTFREAAPVEAYLTVQTPSYVSSTFGVWDKHGYHPSRTAYAGFLALLLPFGLAVLATARKKTLTAVWIGVLFVGAAISVLAGYVVPALLAGLLVTGIAMGRRAALFTGGGILAYLVLLLVLGGLLYPPKDPAAGNPSARGFWYNRHEVLRETTRLLIPPEEAEYRYAGTRHLKKFWGEQLAAINIIRGNPVFGAGIGQYQDQIGQSYGSLGKIDEQRLDTDAQNGYLLTAASMGFFGLACLLALYVGYLTLAWRRVRQSRAPWEAALFGALVALIILTLATNPWVRGTSVLVAALFAAIGSPATQADETRI